MTSDHFPVASSLRLSSEPWSATRAQATQSHPPPEAACPCGRMAAIIPSLNAAEHREPVGEASLGPSRPSSSSGTFFSWMELSQVPLWERGSWTLSVLARSGVRVTSWRKTALAIPAFRRRGSLAWGTGGSDSGPSPPQAHPSSLSSLLAPPMEASVSPPAKQKP